jgi:Polyketide cyclase / dehydrase and lipid transport
MRQPTLKNPVVGRAEIAIKSSPGTIFDFIGVNFFSNYPRWSPEVVELEQLSDGEMAVGTIGRQVRVDQRRRLESTFQVTIFEAGKCVVFEGVPDPFRCTFDIRATESNAKTALTFTFEGLELRPHMRPFEKLIRRVVQDGAVRTTRNIKHLIEFQEKRRARSRSAGTIS